MRVAILQFAPRLGDPERNQAHANTLLEQAGLFSKGDDSSNIFLSDSNGSENEARSQTNDDGRRLDLLVLPELAFSGYNFADLDAIQPFLEPTAAGPSARWAAQTARLLQCLVAVGYPETTTTPERVPTRVETNTIASTGAGAGQDDKDLNGSRDSSRPKRNFNSLLVVDPHGKVCAHYRKTHLYYTDATWAEPSPEGFISTTLPLPLPLPQPSYSPMKLMRDPSLPLPQPIASPLPSTSPTASFAICMDLNPQYFTAPWSTYEAASAAQNAKAAMLVASMAWITSAASLEPAHDPDWATLSYWLERLRPLLDGNGDGDVDGREETLVIVANRTGIEPGVCRAFELDPAVRAAKLAQRAEQRQQQMRDNVAAEPAQQVEQAAHNEAALSTVQGSEPFVVQPPVLEPHHVSEDIEDNEAGYGDEDDEDEDEKGRVFMEEVRYAGSSTVMALGGGRARVWGVLGRAEETVLVVDTHKPPMHVWRLRSRAEQSSEGDSENGSQKGHGSEYENSDGDDNGDE